MQPTWIPGRIRFDPLFTYSFGSYQLNSDIHISLSISIVISSFPSPPSPCSFSFSPLSPSFPYSIPHTPYHMQPTWIPCIIRFDPLFTYRLGSYQLNSDIHISLSISIVISSFPSPLPHAPSHSPHSPYPSPIPYPIHHTTCSQPGSPVESELTHYLQTYWGHTN